MVPFELFLSLTTKLVQLEIPQRFTFHLHKEFKMRGEEQRLCASAIANSTPTDRQAEAGLE